MRSLQTLSCFADYLQWTWVISSFTSQSASIWPICEAIQMLTRKLWMLLCNAYRKIIWCQMVWGTSRTDAWLSSLQRHSQHQHQECWRKLLVSFLWSTLSRHNARFFRSQESKKYSVRPFTLPQVFAAGLRQLRSEGQASQNASGTTETTVNCDLESTSFVFEANFHIALTYKSARVCYLTRIHLFLTRL